MKLGRRDVLKGIAAGTLTLAAAGTVSASGQTRYLVEATNRNVRSRLEESGYTVQAEIAEGGVLLVIGPDDDLDRLTSVRGVSKAVQDFQFRLEGPEQEAEDHTTDIELPEIHEDLNVLQWDKDVTDVPAAHEHATGEGTSVAIIDTGVGVTHPLLIGDGDKLDVEHGRRIRSLEIGTVLDENSEISAGGFVADPFAGGEGEVESPVDRGAPWLGTTVFEDWVVNDVDGHGTNVAGIAAAKPTNDDTTDSGSVTGTAPDATILPLRVFYWLTAPVENDEGELQEGAALFTTTGDILMAIDYAAAYGVDAMNLSIGTLPIPPQGNAGGTKAIYQTVIQSAVRRGSLVVVSAGNSEADLQRGGYFTLPNSVAGAMSISATGPSDELAFYSNYGTNEIDVGAPGGGYETLEKTLSDDTEWPFPLNLVYNAYMVEEDDTTLLKVPTFAWLAGTSMAAPQVTGAAALVREVMPQANPNQVEGAIEQGAELVQGKNDEELGAGRLSAAGALKAVMKKP